MGQDRDDDAEVGAGERLEADAAESEESDDRSGPADAGTSGSETETESGSDTETESPSGGRWWAVLAAIMIVELFVYGRRGEIEVCVGKQGVHDFELRGQERNDTNRWKFPRCESRMNLGLRSHYDERVQEAVNVACRGATLFRNRGESQPCLQGAQGWQHRIDARYVWPWDPRFYEHLFWFLL